MIHIAVAVVTAAAVTTGLTIDMMMIVLLMKGVQFSIVTVIQRPFRPGTAASGMDRSKVLSLWLLWLLLLIGRHGGNPFFRGPRLRRPRMRGRHGMRKVGLGGGGGGGSIRRQDWGR